MNTRFSTVQTIAQVGGLMFNLMECASAPSLPQVLLFTVQMLLAGRRSGNWLLRMKALLLLFAALGRALYQTICCKDGQFTGYKLIRYFLLPPDLMRPQKVTGYNNR
jgi:hypothetical protein